MPVQRVVTSREFFHYQSSQEFEEFKDFYTATYPSYTGVYGEDPPKLNNDGSITYYSGSGQYSTIHPGQWFPIVDNNGNPMGDAEFRQVTGPLPAWE